MRQSNLRTVVEQKPLGVIEAVSAGLELVRQRPWTLLVPVLFDVLMWLLPRLSLTALFRPYVSGMLAATALSTDPQSAEEARQSLEQMIGSFHLLGFVATALNAVTRLPSLLAVDAAEVRSPVSAWAYVVPLSSPALVFLLFVPLFLIGLLAVALYLEWIAQGARPLKSESASAAALRVARLWLRLILFSLLLLALVLLAGFVLVLTQAFVSSPEVAALVTLLLTVGLFWVFIYFFFVTSAMALSDVGVRQGLRRSTLMFRAFFWSTLALVALTVFLDRGLAIIWGGLTVSALGVGAAILANAFIGTALLAAAMVYYQDRLNWFERLRSRKAAARS